MTVNAGSNDLTLISGFEGASPITSTIASGGVDPDAAFVFASAGGEDDLVVANAGDGALALFEGGADGLSLMSVENEPDLPAPTALAFSTLTGGQVEFYAATAGRESAELVSLSLGFEASPAIGPLASSPSTSTVVQLVSLHDTSLPLVATVLTLTIEVSGEAEGLATAESQALSASANASGTGISVGQGSVSQRGGGGSATDGSTPTEEAGAGVARGVAVGAGAVGAVPAGSRRGARGVPPRES